MAEVRDLTVSNHLSAGECTAKRKVSPLCVDKDRDLPRN